LKTPPGPKINRKKKKKKKIFFQKSCGSTTPRRPISGQPPIRFFLVLFFFFPLSLRFSLSPPPPFSLPCFPPRFLKKNDVPRPPGAPLSPPLRRPSAKFFPPSLPILGNGGLPDPMHEELKTAAIRPFLPPHFRSFAASITHYKKPAGSQNPKKSSAFPPPPPLKFLGDDKITKFENGPLRPGPLRAPAPGRKPLETPFTRNNPLRVFSQQQRRRKKIFPGPPPLSSSPGPPPST